MLPLTQSSVSMLPHPNAVSPPAPHFLPFHFCLCTQRPFLMPSQAPRLLPTPLHHPVQPTTVSPTHLSLLPPAKNHPCFSLCNGKWDSFTHPTASSTDCSLPPGRVPTPSDPQHPLGHTHCPQMPGWVRKPCSPAGAVERICMHTPHQHRAGGQRPLPPSPCHGQGLPGV